MRTFVALQTFTAQETRSHYVEGLSYTVRPGNRYLNALAEVWALEGKVRFIHNSPKSALKGTAVAYTMPPPPPPVVVWAPTIEPVVPVAQETPVEVIDFVTGTVEMKETPIIEEAVIEEAKPELLPHVAEIIPVEESVIDELSIEEPPVEIPLPVVVKDPSIWEKTKEAWRSLWQ